MGFPSVASRIDSQTTVADTTHTINLGSTPATNDLLVVVVAFNKSLTITWPVANGTWTQKALVTIGASVAVMEIRTKRAAGEGTSITLTTSVAAKMTASAWVISAATVLGGVEVGTATGSSSTPDPPLLTPSWGTADTLWIAVGDQAGAPTGISTYPANYVQTAFQTDNDIAGMAQVRGERQLTAASEDPGVFNMGVDNFYNWGACTIAVQPFRVQTLVADSIETLQDVAIQTIERSGSASESALLLDSLFNAIQAAREMADAAALQDAVWIMLWPPRITAADVLPTGVEESLVVQQEVSRGVAESALWTIDIVAIQQQFVREVSGDTIQVLSDSVNNWILLTRWLAADSLDSLLDGVSATVPDVILLANRALGHYRPRWLISGTIAGQTRRYSSEDLEVA